jgi:uncharacterized protein YkwD
MSKAGLTLLLTLFLISVSGVTNKTFAQEKLKILTLSEEKKISTCSTPLQALLVTQNDNCEVTITPQKDFVAKFGSKDANEFSYSTEPTRYVPTQQPAARTITIVPSIIPNPVDQTPHDNMSADGANLNPDVIFDMINAHRAAIRKAPFQKEPSLCSLAKTRSTELHDELFVKGGLHSGLYNRNLPYWITENAKYGSNEAGTVQWWLNSPIHRSAIEGDSVYSCGACVGTQCSQLFTSFTPKGGIAVSTN